MASALYTQDGTANSGAASGQVGIGTSSTTAKLHVKDTSGGVAVKIEDN